MHRMSTPRRTTPRYQTLADQLLQLIKSGEFGLGSQFPTEFEICAQYAVSRHTARAALARLNALGMIVRRPGAGTHVCAPEPPMRYQREVDSIDDLLQYGRSTRLEMRVCERVAPPPEVARILRLRSEAPLIRLFGLRFGEHRHDEPICTTEVFLRPARGLPNAALLDPTTAVPALMRTLDLRQMSLVEQTFDAMSLPRVHARMLGVKTDSAALRVLRVYHGPDNRLVGCAISLHPSGRFAYSMRLERRTTV